MLIDWEGCKEEKKGIKGNKAVKQVRYFWSEGVINTKKKELKKKNKI